MLKNTKPDIVLKTVKGFNIKRTPFIILISENSCKFGIVILVMMNVGSSIIIDSYFQYGPGS